MDYTKDITNHQSGAHPHTGRYGAARAQRAYIASHSNSICKSKRFLTSNFVT